MQREPRNWSRYWHSYLGHMAQGFLLGLLTPCPLNLVMLWWSYLFYQRIEYERLRGQAGRIGARGPDRGRLAEPRYRRPDGGHVVRLVYSSSGPGVSAALVAYVTGALWMAAVVAVIVGIPLLIAFGLSKEKKCSSE